MAKTLQTLVLLEEHGYEKIRAALDVVHGRGAWPFYYKLGLDLRSAPQSRDAHGIYALKRELIFNGNTGNGKMIADMPTWGKYADIACKAFQKSHGLLVDGVLGPKTARAMFHKRFLAFEDQFGIPNNLLTKIKTLESSNDPVAQGYVDLDDEGLMQINLHFHPEITTEFAWDPAECGPWGGSQLASSITYCDHDLDGGVAAWNIGRFYARQWVRAGKPASGGPLIGSDDAYARATKYVQLVKASAV